MKWFAALTIGLLLTVPATASHVDLNEISWACGGHSGGDGHPDDCGINPVGGSGVQSVGNPMFGDAWIDDHEMVLGIDYLGERRAYPIKMLDRHEIVNDVIGGVPVAVTYCPLCGSGVAFERTVDGVVQSFAPSGFLWNHDMVMWDPSGTLRNQITTAPIAHLEGNQLVQHDGNDQLVRIPIQWTSWGAWHEAHPDATMLQPLSNYGDAYPGYENDCRIGIGSHECSIAGEHPKMVVIGAQRGQNTVAFPLFGVLSAGAAAFHADQNTWLATATPSSQQVWFAEGLVLQPANGQIWRDQHGVQWDVTTGESMLGGNLEPIEPQVMYWFAWHGHHPDTGLWNTTSQQPGLIETRDTGHSQLLFLAVLFGAIFLGVAFWKRRGAS